MGASRKLGIFGIAACLVVLALLLFTVAGCGSTSTTTTAASTATTAAVTTTAGPATTAASTGSSTTAASTAPTKTAKLLIGASMPLSGPASVAGLAVANGWKAAIAKVNADGGINVGDTNYTLDFTVEDSKGTTDGATTAATKLALQDNAKFILGDISDNMAGAIVCGQCAGRRSLLQYPSGQRQRHPWRDRPARRRQAAAADFCATLVRSRHSRRELPRGELPERQEGRRRGHQLLRLRLLQRGLYPEVGSARPDRRKLRTVRPAYHGLRAGHDQASSKQA